MLRPSTIVTTAALPPRPRTLRAALRADVGRAIAIAAGGALAFAPVEYALTLWAYPAATSLATKLRLLALVATLALVLWLVLAAGLAAAVVASRILYGRLAADRAHARAAPWLEPPPPALFGPRPGVARLWATAAAGAVLVALAHRAAVWALVTFKQPQLTAAVAIAVAVVAGAAILPAGRLLAPWLAPVARGLDRLLGRLPAPLRAWNPLGRYRAAGLLAIAVIAGVLAAAWFRSPVLRTVLPIRLIVAGLAIAVGCGLGLAHRRPVRPPDRQRARILAAAGGALAVATLLWWGGDLETKYVALTSSPALERLVGVVRTATDLDRDGYGSLLGDRDCAPFDRRIHPGARDLPGDGIDQDCNGRDFSLADLAAPPGPERPLPAEMKREWNILLLTIDTIRYDRTTFGGYRDGPKRRDTTPRLAELVERSTSYSYAQAPSAGTMASIPAILTSKFFHSGIAIDEQRPAGTPPKIMLENTTLPEIMKRGGYRTGAIGSHEWWNDWGLDQGVDDYDNSIGKQADPFRVVADKVTDHALAWISRHQGKKWFLWAHYIDPHGRYVAHPNVVDWGPGEADLYDAEVKWTDQEVGRLLDSLAALPSHDNTIIVITSDHGESMGEHNIPLGTHGSALYREMTHVPLIFYVPGNKPRVVRGAVSNLDIVPTVAELTGIDVRDLAFEGRSLVPSLFYAGTEDRDRIVFAETNAPGKQRAAISERWRLIYHLASNVYELFDRETDPTESRNLALGATRPPAFDTLRSALEAWMNRVLYAQDPLFNQAYRQLADVLVHGVPAAAVATPGVVVAGGAIEVVGIGPAAPKPGKPAVATGKLDLHVYLRAPTPPAVGLRFQLVVWPERGGGDADRGIAVRSPSKLTADGAYTSDRWKPGEYIRERFPVTVPAGWTGPLRLALVVTDPTPGAPAAAPVDLGTLQLGSSPKPGP